MGLNFKALIMEFLGVFALCYIGGLSCCTPVGGTTTLSAQGDAAVVNGPLAHMLALMVMIYVGAATSGAHYNPAVSLAMLVTGNQSFVETLLYMAFQFAGGLCAGFMVYFICMARAGEPHNMGYLGTYPSIGMTSAQSSTFGHEFWRAFFLEFLATFFLVWMVFGTAVDQVAVKRGGFGSVYGAAIGGTVAMSAFGIAKYTGAALNPARWLGPWIVAIIVTSSTERALQNSMGFLVYTLATTGGGIVAGITYKSLFLNKD